MIQTLLEEASASGQDKIIAASKLAQVAQLKQANYWRIVVESYKQLTNPKLDTTLKGSL